MKKRQLFFIFSLFYIFLNNIQSSAYTETICKKYLKEKEIDGSINFHCNKEDLNILAMNVKDESVQSAIVDLGKIKIIELLLLNLKLNENVKIQIQTKYKSEKLLNYLLNLKKEEIKKTKKHLFEEANSLISIIKYYEAEGEQYRKKIILKKIETELNKNKDYYISVNERLINRYLSSLYNINLESLEIIRLNNFYHNDIETSVNILNNKNIDKKMISLFLDYENFYIRKLAKEKKSIKETGWQLQE